jgi:hypothetical protein
MQQTFHFFNQSCMSQLPRTEKCGKNQELDACNWQNFHCVLSPEELSRVNCVEDDQKWRLKWPSSPFPAWKAGIAIKLSYYTILHRIFRLRWTIFHVLCYISRKNNFLFKLVQKHFEYQICGMAYDLAILTIHQRWIWQYVTCAMSSTKPLVKK